MKRFSWLLLVFAVSLAAQKYEPHTPVWSRAAKHFDGTCEHACGIEALDSPDNRYAVLLDYGPGGFPQVEIARGDDFVGTLNFPEWEQIEMQWSPDSRFVAITGDRFERREARVYSVSDGAVKLLELRLPETSKENVTAIAWESADRLEVLVEPWVCGGICPVRGFVVEVPGMRVVRRLSEKQVREEWGGRIAFLLR